MKWADDRGKAQGGRTGGEGKHPQGRELHQGRDDLRGCRDAATITTFLVLRRCCYFDGRFLLPSFHLPCLHRSPQDTADMGRNRNRMDWDRMVLKWSCWYPACPAMSCFQNVKPARLRQLTVLEADVKAHNVQRYLRRRRGCISLETPNAERHQDMCKTGNCSRLM